ncbi:MAG: formimidoylglutamase [Bacteroidota bacterium]|nr:formimidoylglutamase [Bacteroidota bacterium]MEE3036884.1 formimidoylglutamase [Bacteroidota bacterium]
MEFELSFQPLVEKSNHYKSEQLGNNIMVYTKGNFPNLSEADLVFFTVPESRGEFSDNELLSFTTIRNELYQLYEGPDRLRIADLGNLILGEKIEDTYQLLTDVLVECEQRNLFSLFMGGTQGLTIAQYNSCQQLGKIVNMLSVDSTFDLGVEDETFSSDSFLSKILNAQPNVLFNYTNVGYQSYLNSQSSIKLIDDLFFEAVRLAKVRDDIEEIEPFFRDADFVSLDLCSIKSSDSPANTSASPNGFSSDEICQIMRYAGVSSRLTSLGIYHFDSKRDFGLRSAKLAAQMLWCFFDGFFHKLKQFQPTDSDMITYHVSFREGEYNCSFYKNKVTEKWWMQIPVLESSKINDRNLYLPCSYNDYLLASQGEMPERWFKAFQKIN